MLLSEQYVLLNYKAVRKKMFQLRPSFHLDRWAWETPRHLGVIGRLSPAQSFFSRALKNSLSHYTGKRLSPARKPYRIRTVISARFLCRGETAPCLPASKVESHISDNCSYYIAQLVVSARNAIRYIVKIALLMATPQSLAQRVL